MPITGNTNYNDIENKRFVNVPADSEKQKQIIDELNKQNISFSALYSNKSITVTVEQEDLQKTKSLIDSFKDNTLEAKNEQAPAQQSNMQENIQNELRKLLLKMSSDPEMMKTFFAAQNSQDNAQQEKPQEPQEKEPINNIASEEKNQLAEVDTSKDSYKLLPIINSRVENQQNKLDNLVMKRELAESKISMQQERINNLSAKAERLETTNKMLKELMNNKLTPSFVKSAAQKAIKLNEDKISKIRSVKIPNRESKIEKQQDKVAKFDRQINLAQCKIDRYTSLNNVIKSFSLINNSDRRKQFASAMDNLQKSNVNLCNARIDISTAKISALTEKYNKSNDTAFKSATHKSIVRQKISRQKNIDKRNKLMGVVIPMTAQPEKVQDEALKQTEDFVNNEMKKDNVAFTELADNIAEAPLFILPEQSFAEPDPTQDFKRILPEIAAVMNVSVSELESKPLDIQNMLTLDYTNNYQSTPEEIRESLAAFITPDVRTEESIEQNKERAGLVMMESYGETAMIRLNENVTQQDVLNVLAAHPQNARDAFLALSEMGTQIDELKYAEFEQSEKCAYTISTDFNKDEVIVSEHNGGKGGLSEINRDDSYITSTHLSLSDVFVEKNFEAVTANPLENAEVAVEGNYDMIDGIINNTPPPKEAEKEQSNAAPATISMSLLFGNVDVANEIYAEQQKDNPKKEKNPMSIDD